MATVPAHAATPGQHVAAGGIGGTVTTVTRLPGRGGARYRIVIDTGHGLESVTLAGSDPLTITDAPLPQANAAPATPPIPASAPVHPFDLLDDNAATPAEPEEGPATGHITDQTGVVIDSLAHRHACTPVGKAEIARMAGKHPSWVSRMVADRRLPERRWMVGNAAVWCVHDIVLWMHDHGHGLAWLPDDLR